MRTVRSGLAVLALTGGAVLGLAGTSTAGADPWRPPPGYVFDNSYFGGNSTCDPVGHKGVADGRWRDYICHEVMRKHTNLWFLYGDLYVKR